MAVSEILVLGLVALVLLGGLVALGIGHRRWSWGTVIAAFLVLLSAATYMYLAARLAARELAWKTAIARYETDIARVRDALRPDRDGGFTPIEGERSIASLNAERDRWRHGLDRVDTWRTRAWEGATFRPPADDAGTGRLTLAAEGNAENESPIGVGARVFLFDSTPFEDGGRYIGEFVVREAAFDAAAKRHVLTVAQTAPRDGYDTQAFARDYESVTVFESLPVDRWLAFYRSRKPAEATDAGGSLPDTEKAEDRVEQVLAPSDEVAALVRRFVDTFKTHDQPVPEEEWDAAAASLRPGPDGSPPASQPGTYWAEVEFDDSHAFPAPAGTGDEEGSTPREYEAGDRAEFDLETALDLRDVAKKSRIVRVFRRRPLSDAATALYGARIDAGAAGIQVEGLAGLMRGLRLELAELARSEERLRLARETAEGERSKTAAVGDGMAADLKSWREDAQAATRIAEAFAAEVQAARRARQAAEERVVSLGRELREAVGRLTAEVERVAPASARATTAPAATVGP
jgi:hypothetical protein